MSVTKTKPVNETTKARNKLDLHALIGPLTDEPEAKTLRECLREAGGFPFVARALANHPERAAYVGDRAGEEVKGLRFCQLHPDGVVLDRHPNPAPNGRTYCCTGGTRFKRWFLVGHRT